MEVVNEDAAGRERAARVAQERVARERGRADVLTVEDVDEHAVVPSVVVVRGRGRGARDKLARVAGDDATVGGLGRRGRAHRRVELDRDVI